MDVYPLTPTCEGCDHVIEHGPYLMKVWPSINRAEYFHPRCYVLSHPGVVENSEPLPAGLKVTSLGMLVQTMPDEPNLVKVLNEIVESVIGIEQVGEFILGDDSTLYYRTPDQVQPMHRHTGVKLK